MLKFALQAGITPGDTLADKLDLLARWGYDAVEVGGADLRERGAELRQAIQTSGIEVCSVIGGHAGWLVDPNPRTRATAVAGIKALLPMCAEVGAVGLIAPAAFGISNRNVLPPFRDVYTPEEAREILLDSLEQIAASA